MRLLVDTLLALMLCGVLAGVVLYKRAEMSSKQDLEHTRGDVRRFQQQITLHAALGQGEHSKRGFPMTVDPAWFAGNLPRNPLLGPGHPWLEIAGEEERDLVHPPERWAAGPHVAQFWYNPHMGRVRARVPAGIPDSRALEMYNRINDCDLPNLFAEGTENE
ncbi:MAG: hypothetical protein ACYSTY_01245 [Planctomycetota bacterium]|jgi:hypothetical protein